MAGESARRRRVPRIAGARAPEGGPIPAVLNAPDATPKERIRGRNSYRITPAARLFIVQCVNSGYGNRQINGLLREKRFLGRNDPDVSEDTLGRERASKDCLLDLAMLTDEARQVGHNTLSLLVIYWGEIADAAFPRLMRNRKAPPGPGDLGYGMKPMTVGEATALLMSATKVLMEMFGADVPGILKAEREEVGEMKPAEDGRQSPEQIARNVDVIVAASLERVERQIEAEDEEAAKANALVLGERASGEE